jgi:hypothetical protein
MEKNVKSQASKVQTKPNEKVGYFCRISPHIVTFLRSDARRFNKSADDIAALIFGSHFSDFDSAERAKLYADLPTKRLGRKVSE